MISSRKPDVGEYDRIILLDEDHYFDVKSKAIDPSKLQQSFVAFANADGGELYIGVEDKKVSGERVIGFAKAEDANPIILTLLELTKPSVENVETEFIDFESKGLVLHISIPKSHKVHYTASDECYIRLNAQKKQIKGDRIIALGYSKGASSYESNTLDNTDIGELESSSYMNYYLEAINSQLGPEVFLTKQKLVIKRDSNYKPTVASVLLFHENPQVCLPTRSSIKVYRLLTSDIEYKRELLATDPLTIDGPIELQIRETLKRVHELITLYKSSVDGKEVDYPSNAIQETLVNAVLHRDYSLNDDIHVRIYDNRIEIVSPGKLPGYITVENIYSERFSRNPLLVRYLHKLPDTLNHDIGEGLNTTRNEMKKVGLVAPEIVETQNSVVLTLRYKKLNSIEEVILDYFEKNPSGTLTNKMVRELSGADDINKVKVAFKKLRRRNLIEVVPGAGRKFDYKYKKK